MLWLAFVNVHRVNVILFNFFQKSDKHTLS
jgi:hypothetical protein